VPRLRAAPLANLLAAYAAAGVDGSEPLFAAAALALGMANDGIAAEHPQAAGAADGIARGSAAAAAAPSAPSAPSVPLRLLAADSSSPGSVSPSDGGLATSTSTQTSPLPPPASALPPPAAAPPPHPPAAAAAALPLPPLELPTLACILRAFSAAGVEAGLLFDAAAAELPPRLSLTPDLAVSAATLASTAWAFAHAKGAAAAAHTPAVLAAMVPAALLALPSDKDESALAELAAAFATAAVPAPALLDAIASCLLKRGFRRCLPSDLCALAWAFTASSTAADALLDAVAAEATHRRLLGFAGHDVARMLWAMVVTESPGSRAPPRAMAAPLAARLHLFEAAARSDEVLGSMAAWPDYPRSLTNVLGAFVSVGIRCGRLFATAAGVMLARGFAAFTSETVAETLWAFAAHGSSASPDVDEKLFEALAAETAVRLRVEHPFGSELDLGRILWAFTVGSDGRGSRGEHALALYAALVPRVESAVCGGSLEAFTLSIVHAWQLYMELELCAELTAALGIDLGKEAGAGLMLPPSVRSACKEANEAESGEHVHLASALQLLSMPAPGSGGGGAAAPATAHFEADVASVLARLHPKFTRGARCERTGLAMGFAWRERRICIEADGPLRFLQPAGGGSPPVPDGRTLLKRRLLRAAGWKVACVPFFHWARCEDAPRDYVVRGGRERSLEEKKKVIRAALKLADPNGEALGTHAWR
jgi:hypothetical protein